MAFAARLCLAVICLGAVVSGDDFNSGMKVVYSVYRQCESAPDPIVCLKARAVKLLDRAIQSEDINVIDGISLIKREDAEGQRSLQDNTLEELPADPEARAAKVDDLLWSRIGAFMDSHSIQFKMPEFVKEQIEDSQDEEGRGKKKKYWPVLLLGAMMKGSMLHMAIKGLALLAFKALMVSKLALLLAGIVALKKLFSGGHEKTTYEIVKQPIVSHSHQYSGSHDFGGYDHGEFGGNGYGRSLDRSDELPYPHRMAYRAHVPAQTN